MGFLSRHVQGSGVGDVQLNPMKWARMWRFRRRRLEEGWGGEGIPVLHGTLHTKALRESPCRNAPVAPRGCQDLSNYTRYPYLVPAWRQEYLSFLNEVFSSLAICPSPLNPHKVFPQLAKVLVLLSHVVKLKKDRLLPDKIQQLSSNSWVDTGAGITWSPGSKQQQVWGKEWEIQVLSLRVGLTEPDHNSQNLAWVGTWRHDSPMCLNVSTFSEKTHLEEWGLRKEKSGFLWNKTHDVRYPQWWWIPWKSLWL